MRPVTPFVGVWIETYKLSLYEKYRDVTPFVGVWIETYKLYCYNSMLRSHPSWVCGLKLCLVVFLEIIIRHTLRGCVD